MELLLPLLGITSEAGMGTVYRIGSLVGHRSAPEPIGVFQMLVLAKGQVKALRLMEKVTLVNGFRARLVTAFRVGLPRLVAWICTAVAEVTEGVTGAAGVAVDFPPLPSAMPRPNALNNPRDSNQRILSPPVTQPV